MTRRKKQTRFDAQRVIFFASPAACFLSLFAMGWLLARSQTTHEQHTVVTVQYVKAEQRKSAENVEVPNAAVVEETLEIGTSPDAPIAEYNEEAVEAESFDDNQEIADAPIEPAQPVELRNVVTEITPTSFQTNVEIRPKKISEAEIGDRTPGVNPEGNDGNDESVFLTQKHCVYSLVLKKENGSLCYVKLLRPDDWLDSEDVRICRNATGQILDDVDFITDELIGLKLVGDYAYAVWLELPEMGCVGWAKVVDVEDFQYAPGIGNLVTGTFKHISDDVIDLVVEGQTKPIGVTNSHPFWSVDREEFVPAGELLQGERLLLFSGDTARVLQKLPRPGPQDVYNIEVFGEHVYLVTPEGLLAHNGCGLSRFDDRLGSGRPYIRKHVNLELIKKYNAKNKEMITSIGNLHRGHVYGVEYRNLRKFAKDLGLNRKEWNELQNFHELYELEDAMHNMSHAGECPELYNFNAMMKRLRELLGDENMTIF